MQRSRLPWSPQSSGSSPDRELQAPAPAHPTKAEKFKHPKIKHGVLEIKGTDGGDKIALRLQAGRPDVLDVDLDDDGSADFSFERARFTQIAVNAKSGDDVVRIDESNGVFTDKIPTTIDGGDGNDSIAGGTGNETLLGGDGNDSIDGNGGNDVASLGAGDDTFVWDPGDGSDTVEGDDGADTMLFNGANANERVELSANGTAAALPPLAREHHDGHEQRRDGRLQRPRRNGCRHCRRPRRNRRRRRERRPRGNPRRRSR